MNFNNEDLSYANSSHHEYINNGLTEFIGTPSTKFPTTGTADSFLRIACGNNQNLFEQIPILLIVVLVSRLGILLVELGTVPTENIYKIIFYNTLEMANTIMAFALTGYLLSFGKWSYKGIFGYSNDLSYDMDQAIFGR